MSNFDCQQKMIYSGFFSRFSIRQLPHQQMKHYQRKGTHCNEFRSFKSKKKIRISPAQKSFLLTGPGKEDVFIIFICFQTLSVKRPKIFSARIYS